MSYTDILQNFQLGTEQRTVLYPYLREVFINEAPLVTRLPREASEGAAYNIITYDVRPRAYTLNAAINNTGTTLTLTDATPLMVGDVLELVETAGTNTERVMVTALGNNTAVTIVRGQEGTTAVANNNTANLTLTLIGNARTGGEIDQSATRTARTAIPQYVQTFQYPVQVSGLGQAVQNTRLPAGISDVFTLEQKTKMTEMMRDAEFTSYWGKGQAASSSARATQKGLKSLIGYYNGGSTPAAGSNVNVKTNGGSSYTFLNFVADGIQKAIDGGGDPDTVVCSPGFLTGLQTWGFAKQQVINPRENALGQSINEIVVPFASKPITFIPSYQLKSYTSTTNHAAIVLTSRDVKMRYIREEFWMQRGRRGDAYEGDFIGDLCVEVGHPGWHSWVEGITSFA